MSQPSLTRKAMMALLLMVIARPAQGLADIHQSSAAPVGPVKNGLALSVYLEKPSAAYRLGSTISVIVELRNMSNAWVPVTFGPKGDAYKFTVIDKQSGTALNALPKLSHRPVYRTLGGPNNGWPPGSSDFGSFDLNTYVEFDRPGTYDVSASTSGIVDSASRQRLQLHSNHVTVVITPGS